MKPNKFEATLALVGGGLSGPSDGSKTIYLDGQTPPTDEAINAKLAELQAEYDSQEYGRNREPEYPPIGDQLDDLYHKGAFSTDMTATLKAVKDKHPK